jgi:hypothetical protein
MFGYLLLGVIIILVVVLLFKNCEFSCSSTDGFEHDDAAAKTAMSQLKQMIESGQEIPEITDAEYNKIRDSIDLAVLNVKDTSEGYRYWANGYVYDDLYNRLRFWSPGFYAGSGRAFYLRNGFGRRWLPRYRWIRHTVGGVPNYYYLLN